MPIPIAIALDARVAWHVRRAVTLIVTLDIIMIIMNGAAAVATTTISRIVTDDGWWCYTDEG